MAQEPEFNIERATNGLVLALYLAAALFLGVLFLFVLRDLNAREAPPDSGTTAVVRSAAPASAPCLAAPLLAPPAS
jgi:hypothetical protein